MSDLVDPRPIFPSYDPRDQRAINAELFSDFFLCLFSHIVHFSHFSHIARRQLCGGSPFRISVSHIFFDGSEKKMIGVYARWIVALVQTVKPVFYGAKVKFVRIAMSHCAALVVVNIETAVSNVVNGACPFPTSILRSLVYLWPKALLGSFSALAPVSLSALFAKGGKTVLCGFVAVKILWGCRVFVCAVIAFFHGIISYCSYIYKRCGQTVGLAFRVVNYATLAHELIIPQKIGGVSFRITA